MDHMESIDFTGFFAKIILRMWHLRLICGIIKMKASHDCGWLLGLDELFH